MFHISHMLLYIYIYIYIYALTNKSLPPIIISPKKSHVFKPLFLDKIWQLKCSNDSEKKRI